MRGRLWLFVLFIILVGAVAGGSFAFAVERTAIPQASEVATAQATVVYWDDGVTELGRFGEVNRTDVVLSDLPTHLPAAVLTAEDRDFFVHTGFSPAAIARAVVNNLRGGPTQGGSTITQQYAKNAFLTQDQTIGRKARELLLAVKLETLASKDVILERYLNTIYMGRGTYGVQAAAREYFAKDAADLDVAEAAFLATVIRSPGNYDPDFYPDQAEGRWNFVLDGMVAEQALSPQDRANLTFPNVRKVGLRQEFAGTRGYLLETVRQQLYQLGFSETDLNLRGLEVTSTFNRADQRALVKAVNDERPKVQTDGVRIGAVSVRPGTGEIVTLYGGSDYLTNQLNNATQATAMAGSTFKPFALVAGLENDISLQSKWDGRSPRKFFDYRVRNYGNTSFQKIPLLQATAKSVNTVYVALGLEVGPRAVRDVAVRAGLPDDTPGLIDNATIVLGSASPTALNMANAFATFAAEGVRSQTTAIKEVRGSNGGLLFEFEPVNSRVFKTEVMADLNFAMVQAVNSGTGGAASVPGHQVAGKTGTTDNDMSAWFVGYTPELATAVFISRQGSDGLPISLKGVGGLGSVTGGTFPARIWGAYMKQVLANRAPVNFAPPANIGKTTDQDEVAPDEVIELPVDELFPETNPEESEITQPVEPPSEVTPPVDPVAPLPVSP